LIPPALLAGVTLVLLAAGSFYAGIEWQQGRDALALKDAQAELEKAQAASNVIALAYAENSAALSRQLGNARVQLRDLTTGRDCLSAAAVGLLNGATPSVPDAAGKPASAPGAFATDRDVGDALAICRSAHRQLSDQLNAILDIEDTRH
jgi:hypothetical protein